MVFTRKDGDFHGLCYSFKDYNKPNKKGSLSTKQDDSWFMSGFWKTTLLGWSFPGARMWAKKWLCYMERCAEKDSCVFDVPKQIRLFFSRRDIIESSNWLIFHCHISFMGCSCDLSWLKERQTYTLDILKNQILMVFSKSGIQLVP